MYIYVIEYDGKLSLEGYNTIDKEIERLKNQEYNQDHGLTFKYNNSIAKIYEIKVI